MALTIFRSNRVETLQSRLVQRIATTPLADPFAPETVVVPTYAMARWLNLNFARQQGIAANIGYPQFSEWIWSLAGQLLDDIPQQDPCSRDRLGWAIFNQLPGLLEHTDFGSLQQYLDDDASGIKRWQLSQRIADCFDRYQSYRPDLIHSWSRGEDGSWQALLWRKLVIARQLPHRVEIMYRLSQHLKANSTDSRLPERISLFALSRIAPVYLETLHALALRTELLLFQHNPTDQYWADLVNAKQQARKRLQDPRHGEYFDSGNHLLTSWGRQGQTLQDLLLDLDPMTAAEIEDNQPPSGKNLLHSLQASLFHLEPARFASAVDDSISVQLCHSPLRECQVLHDHLLTLLARHDDLCSEDILVMVPEISRYAPYIEAVFQHDASNRRPNLAWNISDISVSDGHPLVGVFLQLLKLPGSRFTRSEILSFLECAEIRASFGLDESVLDDIDHLVDVARVRWGISADQRRELGLPGVHENTWQQAWERIFAGYAMANDDLWEHTAPISEVDSDSGVAIARFRYLFERLVYWRQRLSASVSTGAWQQRLHQLIDEFLAADGATDDLLQPLRKAVNDLGQSDARDLSPSLVSYWMDKQLATNQQTGRLYSGGITFCGMQPMRNIPFAMICVLGMQDNAFPRRETAAEFDLMRDNWRPGDPHKGDEDRYLMLETLLCARRYLYFSYCGRSLKDNSECQPSVLLRELLDFIDSCFTAEDGQPLASRQISTVHPMQAFSPKNFASQHPGYDRHWYDTARLLAEPPTADPVNLWICETLKPVSAGHGDPIELAALLRFFQHPLRYFFNTRLGIRIPRQNTMEDEESFALQGLQKWSIVEQLAQQYLAGEPVEQEQYSARGLLPHGQAADSEWFSVLSEYRDLLERLDVFRGVADETRIVEIRLDDHSILFGEINHYYPALGLMHFSASKAIKSRALISLWLNHLALCAAGFLAEQENSQLFAPSTRGWCFAWMEPAAARGLLVDYLELYRQGQQYPLPVFPETSYAYARFDDPSTAMEKALVVWNGSDFGAGAGGERADDFIRLALHNNTAEPLNDRFFQQCSRRIYGPAIEHGGAID
ncbi:MAG: exodeoxyribonuclease V subunit gamma [Gammaproteobacteria bacterium]|jgi:exodeoxyribonuclease V gamma subunit|nr:exodeoxyribonuclease V subunit gamma [Gammaproteobacteria bacterium]